jgi:hypothetical protein
MRYDNPRQVRYNMETSTDEQVAMRHQWYFFILNTPIEIGRIQQRILEELATCNNLIQLDSGVIVPKHSLHAKLIQFESNKGEIEDRKKIYNSEKFYQDRNLRPMNEIAFYRYIDALTKNFSQT